MVEDQEVTQDAGTEALIGEEQSGGQVEQNPSKFEEQLENLQAQMSQLMQAVVPKQQNKASMPADLKEKLKANPEMAFEVIEEQVKNGIRQVTESSQREIWDRKADAEFPALKGDASFRKAVKDVINELVSSGEYTRENPRLIYRAAQLAAAKLPRMTQAQKSQVAATSEAPAKGITRQQLSKPKIADSDPRVVMAKLMLQSDPRGREYAEKTLEKFKGTLTEYVAPVRQKRGKRLF